MNKFIILCLILFSCSNPNKKRSIKDESTLKVEYPIGILMDSVFNSCIKFEIQFFEKNNKLYFEKNDKQDSILYFDNKIKFNFKDTNFKATIIIERLSNEVYRASVNNINKKVNSCPIYFNNMVLYFNNFKVNGGYLFLNKKEIFNEKFDRYIYYPFGEIYENIDIVNYKIIGDFR